MNLDLTDEETLALAAELKDTIAEDRYPLSPFGSDPERRVSPCSLLSWKLFRLPT
jgi:hypothetical protein